MTKRPSSFRAKSARQSSSSRISATTSSPLLPAVPSRTNISMPSAARYANKKSPMLSYSGGGCIAKAAAQTAPRLLRSRRVPESSMDQVAFKFVPRLLLDEWRREALVAAASLEPGPGALAAARFGGLPVQFGRRSEE